MTNEEILEIVELVLEDVADSVYIDANGVYCYADFNVYEGEDVADKVNDKCFDINYQLGTAKLQFDLEWSDNDSLGGYITEKTQ